VFDRCEHPCMRFSIPCSVAAAVFLLSCKEDPKPPAPAPSGPRPQASLASPTHAPQKHGDTDVAPAIEARMLLRRAQALLEPRVRQGGATGEEAALLQHVCTALGDTSCMPASPPPTIAEQTKTLEKARALMLTDLQGAKVLLVERVFGGKASREETELLKTICKELRDQVCVTRCSEILGQR
jgi:hypothetical protein